MTKPGDADRTGAAGTPGDETASVDAPPLAAAEPAPLAPVTPATPVSPFAAPIRAPRERWVNPAKRNTAILLGVVAAVVLLGAGVLIGLAVGGGHGYRFGDAQRNPGHARLDPRGGQPDQQRFGVPGGRGQGSRQRPGNGTLPSLGRGPGRFGRPGGTAPSTTSTVAPSAAPTAVPTSSHT